VNATGARTWVEWRLAHGRLPRTPPTRLSARYARGALCSGCGLPMNRRLGFELEWSDPAMVVHMHPRCYGILHAGGFAKEPS
jgi:hypothetical protein